MKIAVDIASGERSLDVLIGGALQSLEDKDIELIFVGNEEIIKGELKHFSYDEGSVSIAHADEVIGMDEAPAVACRRKRNASVMVASRLVGEGKAGGFFSPGNTGATLAASLMNIKRIDGVMRPSLGSMLPNKKGVTFILDIGANIDCNENHIAQFAIMGEVFMKEILGRKPRVGILSIGEEDKKGNELTLKAFSILKSADIDFIGNVEGYDIFEGSVDVVVCDGFVGNVVLKVAEGIGSLFSRIIKDKVSSKAIYGIGALFFRGLFGEIDQKFNASDYGGAPLLGLDSCVIVGHGKSDDIACKNAVLLAERMSRINLVNEIKMGIQKIA